MQEIQISMQEVQGKSNIAHLQRVVCMHNKGFNLQYCYHVSELSGFFTFSLNTRNC